LRAIVRHFPHCGDGNAITSRFAAYDVPSNAVGLKR
jgi:hypothetical protein